VGCRIIVAGGIYFRAAKFLLDYYLYLHPPMCNTCLVTDPGVNIVTTMAEDVVWYDADTRTSTVDDDESFTGTFAAILDWIPHPLKQLSDTAEMGILADAISNLAGREAHESDAAPYMDIGFEVSGATSFAGLIRPLQDWFSRNVQDEPAPMVSRVSEKSTDLEIRAPNAEAWPDSNTFMRQVLEPWRRQFHGLDTGFLVLKWAVNKSLYPPIHVALYFRDLPVTENGVAEILDYFSNFVAKEDVQAGVWLTCDIRDLQFPAAKIHQQIIKWAGWKSVKRHCANMKGRVQILDRPGLKSTLFRWVCGQYMKLAFVPVALITDMDEMLRAIMPTSCNWAS